MEEKDLKEAGIDLFSIQPKVESMFCVVDNGEVTSAMIAGTGKDLCNLLARVMIDNPKVRKLFERAYLATVAHIAKQ